MADLVLRTVKNSPIENAELDQNFVSLAEDTRLSTRNSIPWVAGTLFARSEVLNVNDRFYLVTIGGTSSNTAPTHIAGTATNGSLTLEYHVPQTYTGKDVLEKLKLIDGLGSGLDADLLGGLLPSNLLPEGVNKSSVVVRNALGDVYARNFIGTFTSDSGVQLTGANTGFEVGSITVQNSPYFDFHSSGFDNNYDSRIVASLGTALNGQGTLTYIAGTHRFVNDVSVTGQLYAGNTSSTGTVNAVLENTSTANVDSKYSELQFRSKDTVGTSKPTGAMRATPANGNILSSFVSWLTRSSELLVERMRLYGTGNLVLGSNLIDDGVSTLQVNGSARFTGNVTVGTPPSGLSNTSAINTEFAYTNFAKLLGENTYNGRQIFTGNQDNNIALSNETKGAATVRGNGSSAAFLAFDRPGQHTAHLGLDTDNQFKVGGASIGTISYPLLHTGNFRNFIANGIRSNGISAYNTSATITAAEVGKLIYFNGALGTLTLPSGVDVGSIVTIANISNGDLTVARNGSSLIYTLGRGGVPSIKVGYGDTLSISWDGGNWVQFASTAQLGIGQSYQSFSSPNRVMNGTYINTTGKPIQVMFYNGAAAGGVSFTALVNGVNAAVCYAGVNTTVGTMTFIVPPDANYRIVPNGGTPGTGYIWTELR